MTEKQLRLLKFITKQLTTTGICPSYEEMKNHLGLKNKSGVHRIISALQERGYVTKLANRARAVELTNKGFRAASGYHLAGNVKCPHCHKLIVDMEQTST